MHSEIEDSQYTIAELESRIDALESQIGMHETAARHAEDEKGSLEATISRLSKELATAKAKAVPAKSEDAVKAKLKFALTDSESELVKATARAKAAESQAAEAVSRASAAESKATELEAKVAKLEAELRSRAEAAEATAAKVAELDAELRSRAEAAAAKVAESRAAISRAEAAEAKAIAQSAQLEEFNSLIESLRTENEHLTSQLKEARAVDAKAAEDAEGVETKMPGEGSATTSGNPGADADELRSLYDTVDALQLQLREQAREHAHQMEINTRQLSAADVQHRHDVERAELRSRLALLELKEAHCIEREKLREEITTLRLSHSSEIATLKSEISTLKANLTAAAKQRYMIPSLNSRVTALSGSGVSEAAVMRMEVPSAANIAAINSQPGAGSSSQ